LKVFFFSSPDDVRLKLVELNQLPKGLKRKREREREKGRKREREKERERER
jgi:hypothetical protein